MAEQSTPEAPAPVVPEQTPEATKKTTKKSAAKAEPDPRIEYIGEGAELVEFTPDPKATRIRVMASGLILTDY